MERPDLLSLKEAAARFGVSRSHLQLVAQTGKLEAIRLGREWFTTAAAVEAYLAIGELRSRNPYKHGSSKNRGAGTLREYRAASRRPGHGCRSSANSEAGVGWRAWHLPNGSSRMPPICTRWCAWTKHCRRTASCMGSWTWCEDHECSFNPHPRRSAGATRSLPLVCRLRAAI